MKVLTKDSNEEVIVIDEEEIESGNELQFTDEEVAKLKQLLLNADALLGLVTETTKQEDEEEEEEEEEEFEDTDEEMKDEEEEVSVKDKKKAHDSFSSVGATHKRKKNVGDAHEEIQVDIETAWAKRLRGGK
jgi:GTPase SAR1 family protein